MLLKSGAPLHLIESAMRFALAATFL